MQQDNANSISLNKYISSTGVCSRREADKFIEAGKVTINGRVAVMGNRVEPKDVVKINGKPIKNQETSIYIAFNKPRGITCTTDLKDKTSIISYIKHQKRIFPIGRLDKPSEGLIFLTNDGDIVNKILRAGNNHEKEYIVTVDKPIRADFIRKMSEGVPILETVTKKCFVEKQSEFVFRIILTQGLNRQIRRMCEYLGYEVKRLCRVRIMNITLDKLPVGKWRNLSPNEMKIIQKLIANSSKTEEASYIDGDID